MSDVGDAASPSERPASPPDTLVVGGGLLGAALARVASTAGARVVVASRTARAHAGLWRHLDALDPGRGLVPPGGRVLVALAPSPGEGRAVWADALPRLVTWARSEGAASVTVCGPGGSGQRDVDAFAAAAASVESRAALVFLGPLFGQDDTCVWPVVRAVRESGTGWLPRGLPSLAPLFVDDAARAAWRLVAGRHVLRGPELLEPTEIGDAIVRRFGGRWRWRLWPSGKTAARLRAQADLPDAWDDGVLGPRLPLAGWIDRLPGLRRRR